MISTVSMARRILLFAGLCLVLTACEKTESPTPEAKKAASPAAKKATVTPTVDFPERIAGEVEVSLSDEEKKALMGIARQTLDLWVREKKIFQPADVPESLKTKKVNTAWGTLYLDGKWLGCVSSRKSTIVDATIQAVINTAKDRRFENPTPENVDKFRLVLEYPGPKTLIREKNPETIGKQLVPGIHGIYMESKARKRAFFLPYVFVKKVRTTDTWLQRLAKKAGIPKGDWRSPDVGVYRFDTIAFMEAEPKGEVVDLYRYKPVRQALGSEDVEHRFGLARRWVTGHWDVEKERYLMGVGDDQKPLGGPYDWAAHLDAAAMLGQGGEVLRNLGVAEWSTKGWRAWLDYFVPKDDKAGKKRSESRLVNEALTRLLSEKKLDEPLLFALSRLLGLSGVVANTRNLAEKLFDAMESRFSSDGQWTLDPKYQCEATWSAALLLGKNFRPQKMALLKKAAGQCPAEHPYALVMSATLLRLNSEDIELIQLVKNNFDKALTYRISKENAETRDLVGAVRYDENQSPETFDTGMFLWGLAMAYPVLVGDAERLPKWEIAVQEATDWLLQQQITEQSGFYLKNWRLYKGSFRDDLVANHTFLRSTVVPVMAFHALKDTYRIEWDALWNRKKGN